MSGGEFFDMSWRRKRAGEIGRALQITANNAACQTVVGIGGVHVTNPMRGKVTRRDRMIFWRFLARKTPFKFAGAFEIASSLFQGTHPASTSVMVSAPPEKAGMAESLEAISYELGAVFGVAIMGSITTFLYFTNLLIPADLVEVGAARDGLDQVLMMAENTAGAGIDQLVTNAKLACEQAFVGIMTISAVILRVLWFVLALTFRSKQGEPEVTAWPH